MVGSTARIKMSEMSAADQLVVAERALEEGALVLVVWVIDQQLRSILLGHAALTFVCVYDMTARMIVSVRRLDPTCRVPQCPKTL